MPYEVRIDGGAYTFPLTTRHTIHDRVQGENDGETSYIETVIGLEVKLVGTGADPALSCVTQLEALRTVMLDPAPRLVEILLDGVPVEGETFDPNDGIGGPKCREINEIPTNGADRATQITVQLSIYFKRPISDPDVTDLKREVEEFVEDGTLVRKIWRATCTGRTLAKAKAKVLSFRPSGVSPLKEHALEQIDDLTWSCEWTFEPGSKKTAGIFEWSEEVSFTRGGNPWIPDPVVGAFPFMHEGRARVGFVRITIRATAETQAALVAPGPHLTEDGKLIFRDPTQESAAHPPLYDRVRNLWRAAWDEFYWLRNDTTPILKHGDHATPFGGTQIPNGPIGGTSGGLLKIGGKKS